MHENNQQCKHSEASLRTEQKEKAERRGRKRGRGEGVGSRAENYRIARELQLYRHIACKLQFTRLSFKCRIIKIACCGPQIVGVAADQQCECVQVAYKWQTVQYPVRCKKDLKRYLTSLVNPN